MFLRGEGLQVIWRVIGWVFVFVVDVNFRVEDAGDEAMNSND